MTSRDRMHLEYLANAGRPLWGGHLEREEPLSDKDMARWLECGWIAAVGKVGYVLTDAGHKALTEAKQ